MMPHPPIVTFTTDFGTSDFFVGAMKGALLRHCPFAVPIDLTHGVPRHDILFGSIMLERAVAAFPAGTIHVAVVDPGVGTDRPILIAEWPGQTVVCPDNGLITWACRRIGVPKLSRLTWQPATAPSNVFHGRDLMAPAAGLLASGRAPAELAVPLTEAPVLLPVAPASSPESAVVLHVDHFGNVTTTLPAGLVPSDVLLRVNGADLGPLCRTYADVPIGQLLALIGSSDLLEIALRNGSAGDRLRLKAGSPMQIEFH